jgi:hypothetical protein
MAKRSFADTVWTNESNDFWGRIGLFHIWVNGFFSISGWHKWRSRGESLVRAIKMGEAGSGLKSVEDLESLVKAGSLSVAFGVKIAGEEFLNFWAFSVLQFLTFQSR